ncbi:uncharacterized protein LOC142175545 [Nicotiana tabacum]|uniref:Uncharacterized protein LOC142175545 n=1 Tax=Nicotiana tabacum TaxID=4097 RepID=A0AC58TN61_TOBAC
MRDINDKLTNYKELDRSMPFKDIPEARKIINMYSFANGYDLQQVKSLGKAKGQLLVAVGQDSANHFYPLAWAIVDKEIKLTWKWFLGHLQTSQDLKMGEGITFISDMQKRLIDSIQIVLPESHFRFCVRHIEANWCKRWSSGEFEKLLWWVAWSTYEEDFKDQIKNMSQVDDDGKEVVEDLLKYLPKYNNLTESFNAWILQARHKPIIKMLEDIRIKVMNIINEHEAEVMTWGNEYSPKTMELYNQFMRIALKCHVNGSTDHGYEVTESSDMHIVNLRLKKCTCRACDLCGIPCPHAICALLNKRVDPLSHIHWYHTKETYLQTYSHKLQPVRGEKFWKIELSQYMAPPPLVKMTGRPKVKRT